MDFKLEFESYYSDEEINVVIRSKYSSNIDLIFNIKNEDGNENCYELNISEDKFVQHLENIRKLENSRKIKKEDMSHWRIISKEGGELFLIQKLIDEEFITQFSENTEIGAIEKLQIIKQGIKIILEEIF